jgi:hypothetical protein
MKLAFFFNWVWASWPNIVQYASVKTYKHSAILDLLEIVSDNIDGDYINSSDSGRHSGYICK